MHACVCGLNLTKAVNLILHLDLFVHYKQVGAGVLYSPLDKENNDCPDDGDRLCMSPEAE